MKIGYDVILYVGFVIFITGIIGNILNILILSQKHLRSNTCVIVFLTSSVTGTITLVFGLGPRILAHWNLDIRERNRPICKLNNFFLFQFRLVTFWLFMLATIDRWLLSSHNVRIRRLNSIKNTIRSILCLLIFSMTIHIQIIFCYDANLPKTPIPCFNKNNQCRLANDFIFAIVTTLTPLIVIFILGWITIVNIRSSQYRIRSNEPQQQQRIDRRDRSLLKMLLIQVILFGFLTLPFVVCRFYTTLTMNHSKSFYRNEVDKFIFEVLLLLTFIPSGMQFYVNTLSGGHIFRKASSDKTYKLTSFFCSSVQTRG